MRDGFRFARSIDQIPDNRCPADSHGPHLRGVREVIIAILKATGRPLTVLEIAQQLFMRHDGARRKYGATPSRVQILLRHISVERLPGGFIRLKGK